MVAFGAASAVGLEHFWEVCDAAAAARSGTPYVPIHSLADIDGADLPRIAVSVAIAFAEPLTYWILGGKVDRAGSGVSTVTRLDSARRPARADRLYRDGQRVSFRRLAAEIGTSKSKVERVLNAANVSIAGRWPPAQPLLA
jgi:hypothetical protein